MAVSLQAAQAILEAQAFSKLLGARLVEFGPERVEIHITISEQLKQQSGLVHGGVLAYAADNALTFAGGSVLGPAVVTSEFKINYARPARGECIVARAYVVSAGKTQAVCRCEIFNVAGETTTLCAAAQGTIVLAGSSAQVREVS